MSESIILNALNFAYDTVMMDEDFQNSDLTPEDAEQIVFEIVTKQFPKCFSSLKTELIKNLQDKQYGIK